MKYVWLRENTRKEEVINKTMNSANETDEINNYLKNKQGRQ